MDRRQFSLTAGSALAGAGLAWSAAVQAQSKKPELGVHYLALGTPAPTEAPAGKVEVLEVLEGSPAQKAGLIAGDVVEALETQPVSSASQFSNAVRARAAEDEITLKVLRDNAARELRVKLASRPKEDEG